MLRRLLILLGLTAAGIATAQTAAPVPPREKAVLTIQDAVDRLNGKPAPGDADPALWVVRDADTTIYLFGTVHVLKPGLSWFDEGVKKAFDSSDELVLEMVQPDAATMQGLVMARAFDMGGPTLSSQLPADERPVYLKALTDNGLPAAAFDHARPWFAATTLSIVPLMKLGYDPASGPETVLTAAAAAGKKPVEGLETAEQQIGFLSGLPQPIQVKFLESTLKDLPKTAENMDKMVVAWSRGDPARLGEIMNEGLTDSPELAKTGRA
jgi:uncharacterized protein YbaP (TraB family)